MGARRFYSVNNPQARRDDPGERCKVEKLGEGKLLVNDSIMISVDYSSYVKEEDVEIPLDEDYRTCEMPPLPGKLQDCGVEMCRFGCVCDSIRTDVVRTHCGKSRCFFECNCQQFILNGDDGDIRSRLRPRVSLLNWRFMEPAERDKDPPPTNYRQLERGVTVYPRMRRVAVAPQRFRNEYIMSSKFKDTFNRERRKQVGFAKFIRKPSLGLGKKDVPGAIRRNYLVKTVKKENSIPGKISSRCRPCSVPIDRVKDTSFDDSKSDSSSSESPTFHTLDNQYPLVVPHCKMTSIVIKVIERDMMIILLGNEDLCYVTFVVDSKQPHAAVYENLPGDSMEVSWLYLPFPSSGESWLFHPIPSDLEGTAFTCIPEINCVVPTKPLLMHMKTAQIRRKTMALKMMWIGVDSKHRHGHIYLLPALPNVLICGPFPHHLMKTRFNPRFERIDQLTEIADFLDDVASTRTVGDPKTWETFDRAQKKVIISKLQQKVHEEEMNSAEEIIPSELLLDDSFTNYNGDDDDNDSGSCSNSSLTSGPSTSSLEEEDKLMVNWSDAAKLLSV